MNKMDVIESNFDDDLADAFAIAGMAPSPLDQQNAFRRIGRFQLVNFHLGNDSAIAELKYFPNGAESLQELKDSAWQTTSWGLDPLRMLINEMPEGEERTYLQSVEDALSEYSWLQWAVQDTGTHMHPDGDLTLIGHRTKQMMQKLEPLRNPHARIPTLHSLAPR